MKRSLVAMVIVVLAVAGCAGPERRVDGVVIDVDGGLDGVVTFTIVTETGERFTFVPGDGVATFDHGAPLSHLHEHLQTGSPVRVTYRDDAGSLVAVIVDDAR